MLNGYKPRAWQDRDDHLHVPSSKSFSQILNYDVAAICIPAPLAFFMLIGGIVTLANGIVAVGLPLLITALLVPTLLLLGYRGAKSFNRRSYNEWLEIEDAYAKMSKADRKRHKNTLTKAFYDQEVRDTALPLFTELGIQVDISHLKSELDQLREHKEIMRSLER